MKTSIKIFIKLCIFTYLLFLTPFFSALPSFLGVDETFITSDVYKSDFNSIPIKEQLNLMKVEEGVTLSNPIAQKVEVESGDYIDNSNEQNNVDTIVPDTSVTGKKVYIYNTHQQEGYRDNKTVVDASVELSNLLQKAGIQVVYETNDFSQYLKSKGLDYNSSYQASYYYLNEALVNYGGFDLVIDFHRDSVPRESSFVNIEGTPYAKVMCVVGGLSKNNEKIKGIANQLTAIMNENKNGVAKTPMIREAYYNQDVYENSILIEVGSDNNTYEEIKNSTNLLAQTIIRYLG